MDSQQALVPDPSQLFEQYSSKLARVAEWHLDQRLSGRVDGEDIVQSVFRTFFRRNLLGEFQIESSLEIWRLLVHITVLKARAKGRYHTNIVRDARLEVSLDDTADLLQQEPGPDEAVALVDLVSQLLKGLPDWYCDALQKRLEGNSVSDIATQINRARQSIHRAFRVLRQRLRRELEGMRENPM